MVGEVGAGEAWNRSGRGSRSGIAVRECHHSGYALKRSALTQDRPATETWATHADADSAPASDLQPGMMAAIEYSTGSTMTTSSSTTT